MDFLSDFQIDSAWNATKKRRKLWKQSLISSGYETKNMDMPAKFSIMAVILWTTFATNFLSNNIVHTFNVYCLWFLRHHVKIIHHWFDTEPMAKHSVHMYWRSYSMVFFAIRSKNGNYQLNNGSHVFLAVTKTMSHLHGRQMIGIHVASGGFCYSIRHPGHLWTRLPSTIVSVGDKRRYLTQKYKAIISAQRRSKIYKRKLRLSTVSTVNVHYFFFNIHTFWDGCLKSSGIKK